MASAAANSPEGLKSMLLSFRVTELTQLLVFAGASKAGKKSELQVSRDYWGLEEHFFFALPLRALEAKTVP